MKEKHEEKVVLNEQLHDDELEQLKGGVQQSVAIAGEEEDQDVDRGTSHCCNGW